MLTHVGSLPLIQASHFLEEPWLRHGFGLKGISVERYLEAFRIEGPVILQTRQSHGSRVHIISERCQALLRPPSPKEPGTFLEADAFVTDRPGVVCYVRSADCVPILLADPTHRVIGAVHSGWKGTIAKVLSETIETMKKEWGAAPSDMKAAVGPAIGGHCYSVGIDVYRAFEKAGMIPAPWMEEGWPGQWYVDLAFANLELLEKAGVPKERIYFSLACTVCDPEKFASYRREGEKRGEQVSFIMIVR